MRYRNRNTGDVVNRRSRDERLDDMPDRWELLSGDDESAADQPARETVVDDRPISERPGVAMRTVEQPVDPTGVRDRHDHPDGRRADLAATSTGTSDAGDQADAERAGTSDAGTQSAGSTELTSPATSTVAATEPVAASAARKTPRTTKRTGTRSS